MWIVGLVVAGIAVILVITGGLLGWRALMRYFVRQYYLTNYRPLPVGELDAYRVRHHLEDIPWISTQEPVCQSNSLRMVAAQRGIDATRRHLDFLMGFTYGATRHPGGLGFYPGPDPEPGFAVAAPYLGLERHFYVTDDGALYSGALRHYLSQGYPVRVGLDMAILYGWDTEIPHSEVLVGYDSAGFFYHETVCLPEAPCEPGHRPPGEKGLYISDERLLAAVFSQAKLFEYPWRYSLSVFEPGPLEQDLKPIWRRNGRSLIGGNRYGPPQGADVIDGLADEIESRGSSLDVSEMCPGLAVAAYARRENAGYLKIAFPGEADIERAATYFEQAAGSYQAVLEAVQKRLADPREAGQAAGWLRDAAVCEREIGLIFVARGRR